MAFRQTSNWSKPLHSHQPLFYVLISYNHIMSYSPLDWSYGHTPIICKLSMFWLISQLLSTFHLFWIVNSSVPYTPSY